MEKLAKYRFNFMGYRRQAMAVSAILILISLGSLLTKGLNLGIDFTGGNLVQIEFQAPVEVGDVRDVLAQTGQESAVIQAYSDRGVIIRLKAEEEDVRQRAVEALRSKYETLQVLRFEKVGPVVGQQLRQEAFIALGLALLGILAYITVRFQFRFAAASVVALLHDTIITLGVFSLTGREISVTFIAAILTIVGYSLNDTIVVLDRVRENWKHLRSWGVDDTMNVSINQTLSRTINTSLTTFLPVLAFYIWGGPVLSNFSFALMVGILVGTYSSIYVASSILDEWFKKSPLKG
ncbi:protein translocase subunit SecF [Dethiosulfovibrio salsuginis]|uniref:Protein-export membrane protein SecF n=1 Tax=Dethiosulfovibrio salsuginis TaxID=561720 RepID=A0A1X7JAW8_9BACT|nr:protein translocase subunit SecF [Dethiosulfovibrio salsuginis]SMG24503.1 preprotein translocase subunit SecF [Dethiosulfovibrio salsuginis]